MKPEGGSNDVFVPVVALIDDTEEWRLQYHITSRFIWSEFFYFGTAESFLYPQKITFHLLSFPLFFFQPVGVVIMEHCRVTDNCLVLSARPGCKLFPLLQKSPPDRRAEPSSLLTLVCRGRQSLTSGVFQSAVQPKYSDVWRWMLKRWMWQM